MIETNAQAPTGRWHLQPDEMVVLARIAHRFPNLADAEAALAEVGALRQRVADLEERLREVPPAATPPPPIPTVRTVPTVRSRPAPRRRPAPARLRRGESPAVRLVGNGPALGWALAWRLSVLVSGPIGLSVLARQPRLVVLAAGGATLAITAGWLATRKGVGAIWRAVLCSAMVASALELRQVPFQVVTGLAVVLGGLLALDAGGSVLRRR